MTAERGGLKPFFGSETQGNKKPVPPSPAEPAFHVEPQSVKRLLTEVIAQM